MLVGPDVWRVRAWFADRGGRAEPDGRFPRLPEADLERVLGSETP